MPESHNTYDENVRVEHSAPAETQGLLGREPQSTTSPSPTLLERARAITRQQNSPVQPEEIDLALGWLSGQIGLTQVSKVLYPNDKNPGGKALYRMAVCVREAYRQARITVQEHQS